MNAGYCKPSSLLPAIWKKNKIYSNPGEFKKVIKFVSPGQWLAANILAGWLLEMPINHMLDVSNNVYAQSQGQI